jgi:hypothetical protein
MYNVVGVVYSVDVVGVSGGSLLVLVFEAPHSLHTHIRSSLYICNAIQHLLQQLQAISMQLKPISAQWNLIVVSLVSKLDSLWFL